MRMKRIPDTSGLPRLTGERARDLWRHACSDLRRASRSADIAASDRAMRILRLLSGQWCAAPRAASRLFDQGSIARHGAAQCFRWHGPTRTGRAFLARI